MDPIQPIGPRPPWIAELAAEHTRSLPRERRGTSDGERKRGPRREPAREERGPEDDGPPGRHVDVHA